VLELTFFGGILIIVKQQNKVKKMDYTIDKAAQPGSVKNFLAYELKTTRKKRFKGELFKINNQHNAISYCRKIKMNEELQEVFVVLCLNSKNLVECHQVITRGLINRCHVHPREVFRPAIVANAEKIIIAHNHPSGDSRPSQQDIDMTHRLFEAGKLLGIEIQDHIIVGDFDTSMRQQCLLEPLGGE